MSLAPNRDAGYGSLAINCRSLLHLYYNSSLICLSQLANCRVQFLLDRLGRCLKLFVSTESTSSHEFESQFGLEIVLYAKTPAYYRENRLSGKFMLNETASSRKGALLTPVTVDRSPATSGNGNDHSGDRLSQTGDKQQVKTATTRRLENVV